MVTLMCCILEYACHGTAARSDREGESSRRIKTEFLIQMEGVSKHSGNSSTEDQMPPDRVLVLGATVA